MEYKRGSVKLFGVFGGVVFLSQYFLGRVPLGRGSDGFMVRYITGGPNKEGRPEGGGPVQSGVGVPRPHGLSVGRALRGFLTGRMVSVPTPRGTVQVDRKRNAPEP